MTAPSTSISEGPEGLTTDPGRRSRSRRHRPSATFACSLDGAAFAPCTSPTTLGPLRRRPAHVHRASDRHRREHRPSTAATRTFTVDATAPNAFVTGPRRPSTAARSRSRSARTRPAPRSSARSTAPPYGACSDPAARGDARGAASTSSARGPPTRPATSTDARRVALHRRQRRAARHADARRRRAGPRRTRCHATVGGTDADGDRLTYSLDFGDGQRRDDRHAARRRPARAPLRRLGAYTPA